MAKIKKAHTRCWCDGEPTFMRNYEFIDGTGFECVQCGANVWYLQGKEAKR